MILEKRNIFLNMEPGNKEDIIRMIGDIFTNQGCTNEYYTQAMLDKEKVFNTYLGNGVALPHGIEEAKKHILKTGIVLITVPKGQDWGADEKARIIVGIAGKGNEHLDIIGKLACEFCDAAGVEKFLKMNEDEIVAFFEN
jgi:mannitol/fructose-specific phosphotransferase system IIA component